MDKISKALFGDIRQTYKQTASNTKPYRTLTEWSTVDYGGLYSVQNNFDEEIQSILTIAAEAVMVGDITINKNGETVKSTLSQALKYHPTNSETFTQFIGQMFKHYKLYGVAYARIHRERGKLGMKGFKRFEILNPWEVITVHEPEYDVNYYYLSGKPDQLLDKTEILRIKSPSRDKENTESLRSRTMTTSNLAGQVEESLATELMRNSKFNYYIDITNSIANPLEEEGMEYIKIVRDMYRELQNETGGPLVNHSELGEIKEFSPAQANTNTQSNATYKDQKQIIRETAARMLNIPLTIFNPAVDPDQSRYKEVLKQTIVPFNKLFCEALDLAIFTPDERIAGYRTQITSPELFVARNEDVIRLTTPMARNFIYTSNETRAILGLEPVEGGDKLTGSVDVGETNANTANENGGGTD